MNEGSKEGRKGGRETARNTTRPIRNEKQHERGRGDYPRPLPHTVDYHSYFMYERLHISTPCGTTKKNMFYCIWKTTHLGREKSRRRARRWVPRDPRSPRPWSAPGVAPSGRGKGVYMVLSSNECHRNKNVIVNKNMKRHRKTQSVIVKKKTPAKQRHRHIYNTSSSKSHRRINVMFKPMPSSHKNIQI